MRTEEVTRKHAHDYSKGGRILHATGSLMLLYINKINLLFWKGILKRTCLQEITEKYHV